MNKAIIIAIFALFCVLSSASPSMMRPRRPLPVEKFQDNNLGALNVGVNGGNNGFGANAGYQGQLRNGQWNVGGQVQTTPGGRPNWGVNAGVTIKFDEEAQDNDLAALDEFQDNNLGALNLGVNGNNNGFGANAGYQTQLRNGQLNVGGSVQTSPGSRPSFGANAGYQGQLKNGQWNVGGQVQTNPGGRPNWGVNAGVTIKFDEEAQDNDLAIFEDDNLVAFDEFQDNNLGALNLGVNGNNNGFGANAGYQTQLRNGQLNVGGSVQTSPGSRPSFGANAGYEGQLRNGQWNVGGQVQTNPGGRPNWGVNAGVTIKFDEEEQ